MLGISAAASAAQAIAQRRRPPIKQTSTTKRNLTPEQEQASQLVSDQYRQMISNPTAGLEPFRTAGLDAVNKTFEGMPGRLDQRLAARGMARGGQSAGGQRQIEMARAGAIGGVENDFAQRAFGERDKGLSLAENFRNTNFGTTSTGEIQQPGDALGGAVSGGLQTYVMLQQLQRLMGAGKRS